MLYFSALAFFLGAAGGSFLPVLLYRRKNGIPLTMSSRSICDHCGKPLDIVALIPILGYLLLGGKSRCCKRPLPIKYPLCELALGSLLATVTYIILHNAIGGTHP